MLTSNIFGLQVKMSQKTLAKKKLYHLHRQIVIKRLSFWCLPSTLYIPVFLPASCTCSSRFEIKYIPECPFKFHSCFLACCSVALHSDQSSFQIAETEMWLNLQALDDVTLRAHPCFFFTAQPSNRSTGRQIRQTGRSRSMIAPAAVLTEDAVRL